MILAVLATSPLAAQDKLLPVVHFGRISSEDGLFSSNITSRIVRDSLGFVWIGTVDGLARYDGYTIKDYRNIPEDPYSLSSNTIMSLLVDKHQRLWVGTWVTGLSLYDRAHERFLNFLPRPGDPSWYATSTIYRILEDRSGCLWLGTPAGVVRVELPGQVDLEDPDSLLHNIRFTTFPLGTPAVAARDLSLRNDGNILVASDRGLRVLDPVTATFSRAGLDGTLGRELDSIFAYRLASDLNGDLWIGTGINGLFRVDWHNNSIANFKHRPDDSLSIRSNDIRDLAVDWEGNLWIASPLGVELFSTRTGRRIPFLPFDRAPRGATGTTLSVDGTGTLWIGTQMEGGGVHRVSRKSLRFSHYSIPLPGGRPMGFETIKRANDGTFWLSSVGMLYQINVAERRVSEIDQCVPGEGADRPVA